MMRAGDRKQGINNCWPNPQVPGGYDYLAVVHQLIVKLVGVT